MRADRGRSVGGPPAAVLSAFGLPDRAPLPLGGYDGRVWSVAGAVLKAVDDDVEAVWVAEVLSAVVEDGYRINRPLPSVHGTWVVEGWTAWTALVGEHETTGRWREVIEVGERLSAALSGLPRPDFLDAREHPWAVADRMTWDEEPLSVRHHRLRPLAERLRDHAEPYGGPAQVVHGDLSGNVLFAPGLGPGVIDFTPYWRPPVYCSAIVVVDALLWHAASMALIRALPDTRDRASLLARAATFRLVAADRLRPDDGPGGSDDDVETVAAGCERLLSALAATVTR